MLHHIYLIVNVYAKYSLPLIMVEMHHAYVYEGSQKLLENLAQNARALFHFNTEHDPDVRVESFEKFGIDDAEALKTASSFKTVSGRALHVLGFSGITTEAQQALLKLFEEPQKGLIFVLLVPHGSLIGTLRSRMLPYPQKLEAEKKSLTAVKKFLGQSFKERSAAIVLLLKDEDGVRERARAFLSDLESELYARMQAAKNKKELCESLDDITKVRSYLSDRSPSLKMLLEHVAATLPKV